jgi:hypothetical protein
MSRLGLVDLTERGLGRERVVTRAWHHGRTRSKESTMHMRRLGSSSPWVSEIGLGYMGMSEYYGPADGVESVATRCSTPAISMAWPTTSCWSGAR